MAYDHRASRSVHQEHALTACDKSIPLLRRLHCFLSLPQAREAALASAPIMAQPGATQEIGLQPTSVPSFPSYH